MKPLLTFITSNFGAPEVMIRNWCRWAWDSMVILADGRVTCSCYDPKGLREMGNIHDQSLWEIWNGPRYQSVRREFQTGEFNFCKGCGQNQAKEIDDNETFPPVMDKYPRKIHIEPSAVCNLRCGSRLEGGSAYFCDPKIILQHRDRKLMSFDDFKKIFDEAQGDLEELVLFDYGEAFLNPDAIKMITYAKQKKESLYVYSSTNGHFFDTEEKQRNLVASGIDRLMFSVDGTDQATYEKYRTGGNLERVFDAMRGMARIKREMGVTRPLLEWRYILFSWNDSDDDLDRARRKARELGIDRLIWHLTSWPEGAPSERFKPGTEDYKKIEHELFTTPGSNALKAVPPVHTEDNESPGLLPRRWANQILVRHEMHERTEYASGYPYHAIMDPTNICTLKCPFCPTGNGSLDQPKGKMPYDKFKQTLDLLGPHLFELSLYNWGEPFLHARIFDMIRYAKKYRIRTVVSSNLNHLGKEKAEILVKSGLDELIVSADGITPETYTKYRVGGNFTDVVRNIFEIDQAKRRLGMNTPFINYQFLVFRHNEHEIPEAEAFGRKIGANRVKIIPAWISDPEWIPENDRYSRYKKKPEPRTSGEPTATQHLKPGQDSSCHWLWNTIVINWDGSVFPCCSKHEKALSFGNIFEQPFDEVWNGKRYREARRFVRTGERSDDSNLCFPCTIIGQRNFNDSYFKHNPLVKTMVETTQAVKSPQTAAAASASRGSDKRMNPQTDRIARLTLKRLKAAEQGLQSEMAG